MEIEYGLPNNNEAKSSITLFKLSLIILFILVLVFVSLTQGIAYKLGYNKDLGDPIAGNIYNLLDWIKWTDQYYAYYETTFNLMFLFVASIIIFIFGGFAVMYSMSQGRKSKAKANIHGSARWASAKEIKKSGFLNNSGVYIGGWYDKAKKIVRYLRHSGAEHILVFAPTRSGKGVGLVLPTLLSWPESALILDIKGEAWELTSGWRREHANNVVLKFDASAVDGSSVKFNPLEEIRIGTDYEIADVQNITSMIVDPDGKGLNDHWSKTGHALLVGAILHVLYKVKNEGGSGTLKAVAELLSDPSKPIESVFEEMMSYKHQDAGTHPVIAASARDMLNKADAERSSVLSTAMSFLTLYRDPIVARNTEFSEFKIRDLMDHDNPVSLYIVLNPNDKTRLKPLIRLMLNQIMRILTEKMAFINGQGQSIYKHKLLLMLDEFPSLGKMDIFQESLAFIAGYGMKAYIIVQDLSQLYAAYTKDESIISNCHIRIAFAPNKIETAELLSKMTGETTVEKSDISTSGKRFSFVMGNITERMTETKRNLLTPDECMRLPAAKKDAAGKIVEAGDMLIFQAGSLAIYGKQILFFTDPVFSARSAVPSAVTCRIRRNMNVNPVVGDGVKVQFA